MSSGLISTCSRSHYWHSQPLAQPSTRKSRECRCHDASFGAFFIQKIMSYTISSPRKKHMLRHSEKSPTPQTVPGQKIAPMTSRYAAPPKWPKKFRFHFADPSGQIIATSHDLTPNGCLVRSISLFQENLGWWNLIIWPDPWPTFANSFHEDLSWWRCASYPWRWSTILAWRSWSLDVWRDATQHCCVGS